MGVMAPGWRLPSHPSLQFNQVNHTAYYPTQVDETPWLLATLFAEIKAPKV